MLLSKSDPNSHRESDSLHAASMSGREILIEAVRLGDVMKVSALDPETGLEACAVGPPHARADLETLALGKLRRLLSPPEEPLAPPRPGKVV